MKRAISDGRRIAYDDVGPRSDEAFICLPGWCVNRGFFSPLVERLAEKHRVLSLDWRGHGDSDPAPGVVTHEDLARDALAVVAASGAKSVIPIAQAHGGWVAIEVARRANVRAIVATSWLVLDPPPPFSVVLAALQDESRWQAARDQLFAMWTTNAPPEIGMRVRREMGAYGFATWANAGHAIAAEYERHGNAIAALPDLGVRFLHVFSQPRAPEFLEAQRAFAKDHPWFRVARLEAASHFPTLEVPAETALAIERFAFE